ncbi:putative Pentatricopeptide repeat superfamily protein [Capsicum annuum]|nr:putative Pentatricopeptide repeat superfamily protein [Capsicum annuum]KAF3658359.1 putative Pentatricopeptide repeat superfamily protein [Capsicum annuum]
MGSNSMDISEAMRKFGDEKSTLLDEYERITFEIQLNQAILARSLSEPGRRSTTASQLAPPPLMAAGETMQGQCCRQHRRRGYGFQKVMKKLLKPILGKIKGDNNNNRNIETPKDPRFWNKFSRSLRL